MQSLQPAFQGICSSGNGWQTPEVISPPQIAIRAMSVRIDGLEKRRVKQASSSAGPDISERVSLVEGHSQVLKGKVSEV